MTQPSLFDGTRPEWVPVPPRPSFDEWFAEFDAANPWLMLALRDLTREYVAKGYRKVGIAHLFEIVRWQWAMSTTDEYSDLKLNNSLRSRYSRALMERYPDLDGVFDVRELRAA